MFKTNPDLNDNPIGILTTNKSKNITGNAIVNSRTTNSHISVDMVVLKRK